MNIQECYNFTIAYFRNDTLTEKEVEYFKEENNKQRTKNYNEYLQKLREELKENERRLTHE